MRRSRSARLLLGLCLFRFAAAAAQAQGETGIAVTALVDALREQGVAVIYSTDLLDESMRVRTPLTASTPLDRLDEALGQHELMLRRGPNGSWLVVPADGEARDPGRSASPSGFTPAPPALELVIVTASQYAFRRALAPSEHEVDRRQLADTPTLGEDALRTTHALPGLTSSGLTARVNVRGGEADEALLLLDGVELYNPYHLKDFQGLFGTVSPRILEAVNVRTGAFPAEFGGRMSAVIEMQTIVPDEARHHEIGISTLSSSVLSSGTFAEDRGAWLTSVRRGNLDLMADALDAGIGRPQYTDFFNKVSFSLNERSRLTGGLLSFDDKITLRDEGAGDASADYDDSYVWLALDHAPHDRLEARYQLAHARLRARRDGRLDEPGVVNGSLGEDRTFDNTRLTADWLLTLDERQRLKAGISLESADARYDFVASRSLPYPIETADFAQPSDERRVQTAFEQEQYAIHASYRVEATAKVIAELGLRWDSESTLDQDEISPRLGVLIDLGDRSTLRASWGRFHQPQGIHELQVSDGLAEPYPAQSAEHTVLSFEHDFTADLTFRTELYRKEFEDVRPRFENLFSRVSLLPELLPDRVMIDPAEGEARGIELSLAARREAWQWWLSLTRASVEDELAGRTVSRSWEERWSTKGGLIWSGPRWTVSATTTWHAGWPITSLALADGRLESGGFNSERLGSFRTIDVRGSRRFALERGGIEFFVEVTNVLDFGNACCFDYSLEANTTNSLSALSIHENDWLPAVPSIGFLWQL